MTIKAENRNGINQIRRAANRLPDLAVLGQTSDANAAVFVNERPGYWWVRPIQAGGTYGPPMQVRGCLHPMATTPGTTVKLGTIEGERAVIDVDFVSAVSQGVNPTQSAVVDPNANLPAFVNQAFIATAYEQIVEGTLIVAVRGSVPLVAGVFVKVEGQCDFTGNVPSAGLHRLAVTAVLSDLSAFETQYSTSKSTLIPLDIDDLNEAWSLMSDPLTNKPLWAWSLADAQTTLVEANRFLDIRQFLNWETATAGGTFYQTVQSNGTPATQEPILDFINGTNTTVTVTDDGPGTRTKVAINATGSGDVVGPSSATNNDFAAFDGTTGKLIKDSGLSLSTDGTFVGNSDSLIPSQKATKSYVDAVATGLSPKSSVFAATATALPTNTYSNGVSGVGATLTGVATGTLTVDGLSVPLNAVILVKDEVTQSHNGRYLCTTAGAIGVAYILTRTTDSDTSAEILGSYMLVDAGGSANAGKGFVNSNASTITIGSTAITYVQFSDVTQTVALTGDVTGSGTTSIATTLATVNSNVGTFSRVKSVTANAKGLITAITQGLVDLATEVTGLLGKANGGTGVDLSATGGATQFLAQDGSHVISARVIADADLPTALAGHTISGGSINNTPIGATTANTAIFSALSVLIGGFKAIFSHANSADRTYTFPDATGNVLVDTATQNASNKTITSSSLNSTPIGASSASTAIFSALSLLIGGFKAIFTHSNTADRTYTLPDATTTLVGTDTTQTLTNKLLQVASGNLEMTSTGHTLSIGAAPSTSRFINFPDENGTVLTTASAIPAALLGVMTGDSGSGGAKGAVPAPAAGDAVHGFFGDGTYSGTARKLVDLTVLGASAANIDLTSIPATYKHLMIELELRSDRASNTNDNIYVRFNNDSTAANYYSYSSQINGTTPSLAALERLAVTATGIECNLAATAATAPANEFAYVQIWLYNYTSILNNRKALITSMLRTGTTTGNLRQQVINGWWLNTANAISRVTILPVAGSNWVANSSYMLYGFS